MIRARLASLLGLSLAASLLTAFVFDGDLAPAQPLAAAPQDAPSASTATTFSRLLGDWQGQGELMGSKTAVSLRLGAVLDARFVRLELEHDAESEDGAPFVFLAHGYYRQGPGAKGEGMWCDSRGAILPLKFEAKGDALEVEWGSESTERGRSRYVLDGKGGLAVEDTVRGEDGRYAVFARYALKRKEPVRATPQDEPSGD